MAGTSLVLSTLVLELIFPSMSQRTVGKLWTRKLTCSHKPFSVLLCFCVLVVVWSFSCCLRASCFQVAAYMLMVSGRLCGRMHAQCIRSVHGFGLIIVRASAILAQGPRNNYFQNPTHPHPCFVKSVIFAKHT